MKKDKKLVNMLEKILLWDYSDALQDRVQHCLRVYNSVNSLDELDAFYENFDWLINICRLYTM